MKKTVRYALAAVALATVLAFLRQRRHPIPHPPRLTFLFENPVVGAFVGPERLVERLDLTPGMRVLDAGCGPGRLTIPLAKAVGPDGEVVALDGQPAMLGKLEERLKAEGIDNVRPLQAGLGECTLQERGFDRIVLAMVLGEVRDRASAVRELYAALRPAASSPSRRSSVTRTTGGPPPSAAKSRPPASGSQEASVASRPSH